MAKFAASVPHQRRLPVSHSNLLAVALYVALLVAVAVAVLSIAVRLGGIPG